MRITLYIEEYEEGPICGQGLAYPAAVAFDHDPAALGDSIRERTLAVLEDEAVALASQIVDDTEAELDKLEIAFAPVAPSSAWSEDVVLTLPIVRRVIGRHQIIHVPALGLEVLGEADRSPEDMANRLRAEVRQGLLRHGHGEELLELARLQRARTVRLETLVVEPDIPTAVQRHLKREKNSRAESILKEVATKLDPAKMLPAFEVDGTVRRLAEALTGSVLLVAPSGTGKTAVLHELVRTHAAVGLPDTEFHATSGARLVAGQSGFGMWQQRCQHLIDELKKRNVVLHLGNLMELMQVGKSTHSDQGIASFLRAAIARGKFTVVVEVTPEQLPALEREDPQLLQLLHRIELTPPTPEQTQRILARLFPDLSPGTVERVETLHRRYAAYSATPGRPVRFLRRLLRENPDPTEADVVGAFSAETGLPRFMLDDEIPLDLDATGDWFRDRVMGQDAALERIFGLLALVKTRLARPGKPLASLLFIGPTGVGKTEVAKALATFLFGDASRITRFDMSEYGDPSAAPRLVGGLGGGEGLLTARMRQQPFSVLLFDEFEKAHPAVFDLFLQMLGEARLTDESGRTADFRNAVILLTSNLGADTLKSGGVGFGAATTDFAERSRAHFEGELRKFLRPEMANRIDAVIPFDPLPLEVAIEVTRKEFERARRRDGFEQRLPKFQPSDDLIRVLAERGFDPRYGGRPLKRAIEREFLLPLANAMSHHPDTGDNVLDLAVEVGETIDLTVRIVGERQAESRDVLALAERAMNARRELRRILASELVNGLQSRVERLQLKFQRRKKPAPGTSTDPEERKEEAWLYQNLERLERLYALHREAVALEDIIVPARILRSEPNAAWPLELDAIAERQAAWIRETYMSLQPRPNEIRLALYGPELDHFIRDWLNALKNLGVPDLTWNVGVLASVDEPELGPFTPCAGELWRFEPRPGHPPMNIARDVTTGLIVSFRGALVGLYLDSEEGLHITQVAENTSVNRVVHILTSVAEYEPPEDLDRKTFMLDTAKCRTYRVGATENFHHPTKTLTGLSRGRPPNLLASEFQTRLEKNIQEAFR